MCCAASRILEPGSTVHAGELVDRMALPDASHRRRVGAASPLPPMVLMGITKASLATDSWLSAASFRRQGLTEGRHEQRQVGLPLVGRLKNVILGETSPAGGRPVALQRRHRRADG